MNGTLNPLTNKYQLQHTVHAPTIFILFLVYRFYIVFLIQFTLNTATKMCKWIPFIDQNLYVYVLWLVLNVFNKCWNDDKIHSPLDNCRTQQCMNVSRTLNFKNQKWLDGSVSNKSNACVCVWVHAAVKKGKMKTNFFPFIFNQMYTYSASLKATKISWAKNNFNNKINRYVSESTKPIELT